MYYEMIQWQLNLGPLGLAIEFLITVVVIAVASWLLFKKQSSVFWKQTDYAYLTFAVLGGIVAAADLATSNWSNELQQNRTVSNGISSRLRDYVAVGVDECKILTVQKDAADAAANAQRDDHVGGIIRPPDIKPPASFKEKYGVKGFAVEKFLGVGSPQFVDLTEADCTFLQQVSYAITSNTLRTTMIFDPKWSLDNSSDERSKDAIKFILSDIEAINKYSDRTDELEERD